MKLRSLITHEMYQAIKDYANVSITPYTPRIRRISPKQAKSLFLELPMLRVGDVGRMGRGGLPPSTKVTNIDTVCQHAKTFGKRSNV